MSRIRSVHPGLWTDERFVSLTGFARLMLIGIWTECDDAGIFEWSPLKLKMRLLPADAVDAQALLSEMLEVGSVMKFDADGKSYGAVRNFCQFQRPKKPNHAHPQTDEVRDFINLKAGQIRDGAEAVGNQLPTGGGKSRQMEDGGGNKEDSEPNGSGAVAPIDPSKLVWDEGVRLLTAQGMTETSSRSLVGSLVRDHGEARVLEVFADAEGRADLKGWLKSQLPAPAKRQWSDMETRLGKMARRLKPGMKTHEITDWIDATLEPLARYPDEIVSKAVGYAEDEGLKYLNEVADYLRKETAQIARLKPQPPPRPQPEKQYVSAAEIAALKREAAESLKARAT